MKDIKEKGYTEEELKYTNEGNEWIQEGRNYGYIEKNIEKRK